MMTLRRADERMRTELGWLDSRHTFSFGGHYDPRHMGFGALRVINDDRVIPGAGFGTHPHRDMEIISWILSGALEHKDSMGNGSVIRPGDLQRMSAGTGVTHSEFNPSEAEGVRFLQIWLIPDQRGLTPSYAQIHFSEEERRGRLRLVASGDGRDGSALVHTQADLWTGILSAGHEVTFEPQRGGRVWVQLARGSARVAGAVLSEGDGASILGGEPLTIEGIDDGEVLVFDLA